MLVSESFAANKLSEKSSQTSDLFTCLSDEKNSMFVSCNSKENS